MKKYNWKLDVGLLRPFSLSAAAFVAFSSDSDGLGLRACERHSRGQRQSHSLLPAERTRLHLTHDWWRTGWVAKMKDSEKLWRMCAIPDYNLSLFIFVLLLVSPYLGEQDFRSRFGHRLRHCPSGAFLFSDNRFSIDDCFCWIFLCAAPDNCAISRPGNGSF